MKHIKTLTPAPNSFGFKYYTDLMNVWDRLTKEYGWIYPPGTDESEDPKIIFNHQKQFVDYSKSLIVVQIPGWEELKEVDMLIEYCLDRQYDVEYVNI